MSRIEKKRRKRVSILTAIVMILNTIINAIIPIQLAVAATTSGMIKKSEEIKVNETPITDTSNGIELKAGDNISYKLDIQVGTPKPKNGDTIEISIPNVFVLNNETKPFTVDCPPPLTLKSQEVIPPSEGELGNGFIKIILEVNSEDPNFKPEDWVAAWISISGTVNEIDKEVIGDLKFEELNTSINLIVKPDIELEDRVIYKQMTGTNVSGSRHNYNIIPNTDGSIIGKEIDYSVAINEKYTPMTGVKFEDIIPVGMELVKDSITIDKYKLVMDDSTGKMKEVFDTTITHFSIDTNKNPFEVNLGDINHKHIIKYKAKITSEQIQYKNQAYISYNGKNRVAQDSVIGTPPAHVAGSEDMYKVVKYNNTEHGKITIKPNSEGENKGTFVGQRYKYKIVVNDNKQLKEGVRLEDIIPEGMTIDSSQNIEIYREIRGQTTGNIISEFNGKVSTTNNTLSIDFGRIEAGYRYIVEYYVTITSDKINENDIQKYINTAKLTWNENTNGKTDSAEIETERPQVGTEDFEKKAGTGENKGQELVIKPNESGEIIGQEIPFEIIVNGKLETKPNLILTDTIPQGMILMDGLKIEKDAGGGVWVDVTNTFAADDITKPTSGTNDLIIKFGNKVDKIRYRVTYKTKIISEQPNYVNNVSFTWGENGSGSCNSTVKPTELTKGDTDINKTIINGTKEIEATEGNPNIIIPKTNEESVVGQNVKYKVVVNGKLTEIKMAILEDIIPQGMILDTNSVKIFKDMGENIRKDITSGFKNVATDTYINKDSTEKQIYISENKLIIGFLDIGDKDRYIIEYECEITDQKGEYKNAVNITSNGTQIGTDNTVSKPAQLDSGSDGEGNAGSTLNKTVLNRPNNIVESNGNGTVVGETVTYSVLVNDELQAKTNAKLTDTLPVGMKLKEKAATSILQKIFKSVRSSKQYSVTILKNNYGDNYVNVTNQFTTVESLPQTLSGKIIHYDEENRTLTVYFGNLTNKDRYKIVYDCEITSEKIQYTNNAKLTYDGNTTGEQDSETVKPSMPQPGTSEKTTKTAYPSELVPDNKGSFINQEVNYTIVVNDKQEPRSNMVVLDTIPDGMVLDKDSIQVIKHASPNKNLCDVQGWKSANVTYPTAEGKEQLRINLGDTFYKYTIKYKTIIRDDKKEGYTNNVLVTWGDSEKDNINNQLKPEETTAGTNTLTKQVKLENGQYEDFVKPSPNQTPNESGKGSFIGQKFDYKLIVNDKLDERKGVMLEDDIPDGMKIVVKNNGKYDIRIYEAVGKTAYKDITDTFGSYSEDTPTTPYIKYDESNNKLTIYFGDIETRYKVEYKTEIISDSDSNGNINKYINDAILTSTDTQGQEKADAEVIPQRPQNEFNKLTKYVKENQSDEAKPSISIKPSNVQALNNKELYYSVLINDRLEKKENTYFTDNIPDGMKLIEDSVEIRKHLGGDTWINVTEELNSDGNLKYPYRYDESKNELIIALGDIEDRYEIRYKTKIVKIKDEYTNTAKLEYTGASTPEESSATVTVDKTNITPGQGDTVINKNRIGNIAVVSQIGEKIDYEVIINEQYDRLTQLKFFDDIPEGMTLLEEGFNIYEIKQGETSEIDVTENFRDKTIIDENLSIEFGEVISKYRIVYKCEITELRGTYSNKAKIESREINTSVEEDISYNIGKASIFARKSILDKNGREVETYELPKGENEVTYSIKVWTNQGAIFPANYLNITDDLSGKNLIYLDSWVVQGQQGENNGDIKVSYNRDSELVTIVNESDILEATPSNPIEVRIKVSFENVEQGTTTKNVAKVNQTETREVEVKKGYKYEVKKIDEEKMPNGEVIGLRGATFDLYKAPALDALIEESTLLTENEKIVSDNDGNIVYSLEEEGFYILKEIKAPYGYEITGDGITRFEVTKDDMGKTIDLGEKLGNSEDNYHIENKKTASSISVTKKDSKDGTLLKGAEFTLYNKNGKTNISQLTPDDIYIYPDTDNKEAIEVTNSEGIANFNNIKPGSYWIVETKAPDYYDDSKLDQYYESVEVTVGPHKTYYYEFENEYNGQEIQIQKQDKDTKQNLAGAEFTIYKYENNTTGASIKTITTNNQGIASTKLPVGTYFIKETKAPDGYVISDYWKNGVQFTVTKSNEILNIQEKYSDNTEGPALNRKDEGKLVITKVDANDTTKKLKGAEFIIESISTGQKYLLKTDGTGTAEINLPAGEYLITEVTAPEGYIEIDETKTITIESNKQELVTYNLTVENKLDESSIKVIKVDKEDNTKRLPGAVFTIYKQNTDGTRGDEVTEITTNAIGIATAKLTPGKYFIIETKAPDGYKLQEYPEGYEGESFVVEKNQTKPIIFAYDNEIIKAPVEVIKVDDSILFKKELDGAEFTIRDANGKIVEVLITGKNKADSEVLEKGKGRVALPPGIYTMQETKAPTGYIESSEIKTFEIKLGQTEKISYTIENKEDKGSIRVLKLDSENSSKLLEGAEFTIYKQKDNGNKGEEVTKLITNELGLSRADLEPGDYIIEETKAPTGYTPVKIEKKFTIKEKQETTLDITFINEVQKGKVEVEKVDSNNSELKLDGAEFTIRDANGKIVEVLITGKNKADSDALEKGKGRVALPPGMYTMQETKAPTGYVESSEIKTFEVKLGQTETISYTIENEIDKASVKIIKVDKDDNTKLLDGAKFTIYKQDKDGKKGEIVAEKITGQFDTSGIIRLDLTPGDYIIEETKAPTGYIQSITDKKFTVKEDEEKTIEIIFENEIEKAPVEVIKVDDSIFFKKKLEGAEFTIKDYKGNIVGLLVTDKNGKASVNLPPGIYTMQETKAPTGYVESSEIKTFEIKLGQTEKISYTIENEEDTSSIKIIKVDKDDNSKKLEGAEFTIYKQKSNGNIGTKVITITSNELGIARADLEPGDYIVVETKAPHGYIKSDIQEKFTITKNQKTPIEFTFVNEAEKGSIEVEKVDEKDTSKKLSGAEFTVKNEVGKIVAVLKTDINGMAKAELSPGIYTMQETKAPTGYIESSNIETFEIKLGEKNKVFYQIKNKLDDSQLKIIKVDKDDHNKVLQGAEFTIKDEDGNIIDVITSNDIGIARAKLSPGVYTVEETKAPDGYIKLNEVKDFTVKENDESIIEFIFENELDDSNIVNPDEEYPDTPGDSDDSGGFEDNDTINPPSEPDDSDGSGGLEDNDTTNPPSNLGGSGSFKDNDNTNSSSPKTGDTGVVLYILLALGSSALLLGLNRKNKNNKKAK